MVTRKGLQALLSPQSFALIGASDKSTFSSLVVANLRGAGRGDDVHLVNPRSPEVHGQATVARCRDIAGGVDLAFVMVPARLAPDALRDATEAGASAAIVLSSGYAEAGEEGRQRQAELVALAESLGITMLGPNVLGVVNVLDGIPAMALSDPPQRPGRVALISQSGASCGAMKDFAELAGVELSHVLTVGNEAMVTIAHLVDFLVDDDRVGAIAIFMEAVKEPQLFAAAARRAAAAGKPIVVLKAGRSELAARAAASHTGALVGDDRVVDAVFSALGVVRVDTIEDMLVTAGLGAYAGPIEGGLGVVSISGGACDIIADLAESAAVEIPEFTPQTQERLRARLPDFGHAHNPLDITGAAITDPPLWGAAIEAVAADPAVGVVLAVNSLPWREDGRPFYGQPYVDQIGRALAEAPVPGLYVTQVGQPFGPQARDILAQAGVPHQVAGLRAAVDAVARIRDWSQRLDAAVREPVWPPPDTQERAGGAALSEADARALLQRHGVPVVPAAFASTADEAVAAAAQFGSGPLVVKIVSPDIAHKTDVGGVRLHVAPHDVGEVAGQMMHDVAAAVPQARIDGVLVGPQRDPATELLVGVTRDPDWGLLLAVGLGGVLVEMLDDVAIAPLPVDETGVRRLLSQLRGARLLGGVRGRPAADLDAVVSVVAAIATTAAALGPRLEALEVNPLRVDGANVEALDALVVLREEKS
ncbi:CoA-binding protein [Aeromicrobium camelliae]|uniref:CoA-binding protein n=1 Tax=Aeromicrobium camelliae TaxID=1538144 RepID=A0A3N6X4P0_9ACTN|nr:CoA-binding protein [Aeromicrobium camelliae]